MKSVKKLVLVGLILLASVMVLVGCKIEPEVPPAKLDSITSLVQSAFSKDEIGDTMMIVVTYDNGTTKTVKGTIISDSSELTKSHGLNKEVTVSYSEGGITKKATFTIDVASYKFTETVEDYVYPTGQTGTASSTSTPQVTDPIYKQFGDYPQTIMDDNVTIGSGRLTRGGLVYQVGSDGNYYVKATENAYGTGDEYKYSNGNKVGTGGSNFQYFKVEPIVWRVLTEDYNSIGKALLLAEKILISGIPWDYDENNYMESNIRKWLNGNSGSGKKSDYSGDAGFLQTAFTDKALKCIAETTVDNTATSTIPNTLNAKEKAEEWNKGKNDYACGNTKDKIFLLSEQEATTEEYGFAEYIAYGKGNTRIRVTTDYAKATGVYQDRKAGYGGLWWLRSPDYSPEDFAHSIDYDGNASNSDGVDYSDVGIVPALCIELQ